MPFQTIYTHDLGGIYVTPHYPEMGREVPWAFGMAHRMWERLTEEHPQYEKYKNKIILFWTGALIENPRWLRSSMPQMVKSIEEIIKWIIKEEEEEQLKGEVVAMSHCRFDLVH